MSFKAFKEFMVGFLFESHETSKLYSYNRQRWQAPDVPAELAKKSSVHVHVRYVSSEILWGSKVKHFLGHLWLSIFIQYNLPANFKQEV